MKRKILFVNLFPEIGGAETSLIYFLEKIDRRRYEPYVLVPKKGYFSERIKKLKVKLFFLELPGFLIQKFFVPGINPIALYRFYKLCKKLKPDLIHLTNITQSLYAGVVSKILGIPVVAISWMNADTVYFYQDLIYELSCNKILAVSAKLKNRLLRRKIIGKQKVVVLTPGVDTSFFKPQKIKNKSPLTVTIASRFDPVKDHMTFFRAMKEVIKILPNIKIQVAQDPNVNLGNKNDFAAQTKIKIDQFLRKHYDLKKKTIFTGYRHDMRSIYKKTDVLVSSSVYESLGMILMEAASSGIPIVSTNFDGQHLIVRDQISGFLVPIKKPEEISKKVLLLLKNKNLRSKFGRAAREHILKNFSEKDYARKVEIIYKALIR